jgi:cell division protein FtsL
VEHSMQESRMASKKMEIEYLYDGFNNPTSKEVVAQKENNGLIFILLLALLVVIGFLAFIIVRNRSRISHIENHISDIEEKHRQENADKDLEISQMVQQLNDTRERLENVTNHTFEEAWRGFNESGIVQRIKGKMEGNDIMIKNVGLFPKLKLKEVDFIDLVRTVNANFTDCSQRFLKDYPDLNTADFRQCCLAMLGMNDAQIAVLQGVSYSGVNRRTKKILSSMQSETTLEQAIMSYLRNNW